MHPADKPLSCLGCPAYEWGVGFVPPEGPLDAKLCIVGQGPGEMEARFSRPFFPQAPSGIEIDNWIHRAKALRSRYLITNLVWCWLPKTKANGVSQGNRDPKPDEIAFCTARHLWPLLQRAGLLELSDRVIHTVGSPATAHILGVTQVDRHIGTFSQRDLRDRHPGSGEEGSPGNLPSNSGAPG